MSQAEEIKKKMKELTLRWQGKEIIPDSVNEIRRKIDRMIYRCLKRKLDKFPQTTIDVSQLSVAKEVFGVKD